LVCLLGEIGYVVQDAENGAAQHGESLARPLPRPGGGALLLLVATHTAADQQASGWTLSAPLIAIATVPDG
jgi:ABC-type sugar transport system substrate-binding protein